ncbi:MAG TPA: thiamine pyrophosphate-dependent enzyme [Candidatus Kapabacteria bacterium]|nr:thiamine pyrophosphate-dependent enzyme [Candidatus Kapabacteria bacterium]
MAKKTTTVKITKQSVAATTSTTKNGSALPFSKEEIIADYRIAHQSRLASVLGRREVLTGKAKFGIFGDGKEVPQLAMAHAFRNGDWRSGYYRDQTFMFATGTSSIQEFFAQLYAHPDVNAEPASAGRMMNGHFATRSLNEDGSWKDLMQIKNSSADISPTSGQMPRLVGLAYASKLFRQNKELSKLSNFTHHGDEVAFGTIGNASTSEGLFFEAVNAAGVLKIPMVLSVWDDGYGISVPALYQTTKQSISKILDGFREEHGDGYIIRVVNGWDYPALCTAYSDVVSDVRKRHIPALLHITELTQPLGHSTSGSHERYKSKERLKWEEEFDCVRKMREWMIASNIAPSSKLDAIDKEDDEIVSEAKAKAWEAFLAPIEKDRVYVAGVLAELSSECSLGADVEKTKQELEAIREPLHRDVIEAARKGIRFANIEHAQAKEKLGSWVAERVARADREYSSHLYSESAESALTVKEVKPKFSDSSTLLNGSEIMRACFDAAFARDLKIFAIGEDIGKIGDVNKGLDGIQEKYGEIRITDTGIREATIAGQAIGAAMRGLRPIAEIQYLDYLLFALQTLSDDLATLRWRTFGGQKAPVIIRTRGHRLEGVWHSGSPMSMILGSLRGMYILTPRNMTQAAGFYNTMLRSDDPALIIEVLNGYRLKEKLPDNIGEFTVPLGVPEILQEGSDVTLVTYGACCRIAQDAVSELQKFGISVELIDVQSLMPFDINGIIGKSLAKTNRIVFLDEDVPGGATAYMMQEVLEKQSGYRSLDSAPLAITAKAHRPAYGSDGDYFSKPNADDIFQAVYELMSESDPKRYPMFW